MVRLGGLVLCATVMALPAFAQAPASAEGRNHARLAILDQCVMSQSGKLPEEGAGPKCGCYATRMSKAMTDEEVAGFKKGLPKRLSDEAAKIFASCK